MDDWGSSFPPGGASYALRSTVMNGVLSRKGVAFSSGKTDRHLGQASWGWMVTAEPEERGGKHVLTYIYKLSC